MIEIRYLFDENMGPDLRRALNRAWPDVEIRLIGEPGCPPKGTPDPDILGWCESNGFILVTYNRASRPVHLADHLGADRHMLGIFVLPEDLPYADIVEQLGVIWGASGAEEYRDRIVNLPLRQ